MLLKYNTIFICDVKLKLDFEIETVNFFYLN